MAKKNPRRLSFSVLAGSGRVGMDVAARRAEIREHLLRGEDLSDEDRLFLVAELSDAEGLSVALGMWDRADALAASLRERIAAAWKRRSVGPLRDALGIPRGKGGRPRLDRTALLEQREAGVSEDELRAQFGLSPRQLREHLAEARRARSESC